LGDTNAFLQAARGQDSIEDTIDNSDDETRRRRSWTREQKLGAIKYATSTYVVDKDSHRKLIANNAAAANIRCTPHMLQTWIRLYDEINASSKGTRKDRRGTTAKQPQIEQKLYELFLQKRLIGRKVRSRWLYRQARIIYGNIYPNRVV
jgi:hypothetical protein